MKKKYTHILFGLTIILFAHCNQPQDTKKDHTNSSKENISSTKTLPKREFGERLTINGDFNGDRIIDTIYESYISSKTGNETYKILDKEDWEHNIELVIDNDPISRIYTNLQGVDTFTITKEGQQIGILRFENLGDINNDEKDELGYIIDWADFSNLNHYHILSLDNNKFKELFSFQINESVNLDPEELIENKYIVKRLGQNKIKYKFYSDSATVETGEFTFK